MVQTAFELRQKERERNFFRRGSEATKRQSLSHIQEHSPHKWTNKSKDEKPLSAGIGVEIRQVNVVNGPVMTSQVPWLSV